MKQNIKIINDLKLNPNEVFQKIKKISDEDFKKLSKEVLSRSAPGFQKMLKKDKNLQAKIIASYVRNNIENFHCKYLDDDQMKELNPLIRNAIYTALIDFDEALTRVYLHSVSYVPKHWEDCEYCDKI